MRQIMSLGVRLMVYVLAAAAAEGDWTAGPVGYASEAQSTRMLRHSVSAARAIPNRTRWQVDKLAD
jgi:hypothetical protein